MSPKEFDLMNKKWKRNFHIQHSMKNYISKDASAEILRHLIGIKLRGTERHVPVEEWKDQKLSSNVHWGAYPSRQCSTKHRECINYGNVEKFPFTWASLKNGLSVWTHWTDQLHENLSQYGLIKHADIWVRCSHVYQLEWWRHDFILIQTCTFQSFGNAYIKREK